MPKISLILKAQLDACTTKQQYANVIKQALGDTRRLRGFRDANSAATDPAATGTEFLNVAVTGDMTIIAGNIVNFGVTGNTTVRNAADLSTGASVLRLEGNGHTITYTLGLSGSGMEMTLPSSPTGSPNQGFAFGAGTGMKAPVMLDSGTGPLSPELTASAPYSVDIEDWSMGSAVVAGTIVFDTRLPNMVFDDAEIASNMGDVRTYRSSTSVTFGGHEFGAIMFAMTKDLNPDATTEPVYQVLVGLKPTVDNWPNYPAYSGYIAGTTDTFPSIPFKVTIKTQAGGVLYVHDMQDGLPINSPDLHDDDIANYPVRPHLNCAQMLPWQSARPKKSTYSKKWMPGYTADSHRPTTARVHFSTNAVQPLISFRDNTNSLFQFYAVPKWPFAGNSTAMAADTPNQDPNLFSFNNYLPYGTSNTGVFRATGWGYEPACIGIIDQFTGPGGTRMDRAVYSTPFLIWATEPNWVRPRGGEPIQDIVDNWSYQFFNLTFHHITDAKSFSTVSVDDVFAGVWGHGKCYYASNDSYVPGGTAKTIPLFAIANGQGRDDTKPHGGAFSDKNGRLPWNGQAVDYLHNYTTPAFIAMHMNSPMHAYAHKHRVLHSIMAQLTPNNGYADPRGFFMTRLHAWRLLHLVLAWKLSADHDFGIPRATVEARVTRELEAIYDFSYKPSMIDNNTADPYFIALRNLGVPLQRDSNNITWSAAALGLEFYMGAVLQVMRQTGFYSYFRDKSEKCANAFLWMIRCLDMQSVEYILETDGWREFYTVNVPGTNTTDVPIQVCANWADLNAKYPKQDPRQDWLHDYNGLLYGTTGAKNVKGDPAEAAHEQDINQHNRFQWVCIHRDYFPEIPSTRPNGVDLAYAKFRSFYDIIDNGLAGGTVRDWTWRWPTHGQFLPPTVVVP